MDSRILALVELLIIVAVVFGFGIAQLRSLKRDKAARHRNARGGQGSE